MGLSSTHLKQVTLGSDIFDISAKYLHDASGNEKTLEEILALHNLEIRVVDELPTASAATMNAIYLVPKKDGTGTNIKEEYITIDNGASASPRYTWEKIGTTDVDLSNYVQKGTYAGTAAEAGAHTHTVTGTVTVPTVAKTSKKLAASASGTAVNISSTANAITGFGTHTTDNALGEATTFAVSGGAASTAKLVQSQVTPAVANGKATKTVFGTDTTASKVTVTAGSDASLSAGAQASFTQGTDSFVQGSKAAWSAAVDANGVLSFSFTANGDDTFTQGEDSFTANTLQTLTGGKATVVSAADVTVPVVSSNAEVDVAKAGTAVDVATGAVDAAGTGASVATGISAITVSANKDDLVEAITALGAPTTAAAATAIAVSAQPTITLDGDAAEGVAYVDTVTIGSDSASLTNGAAAENGAHTHTTSTVLS